MRIVDLRVQRFRIRSRIHRDKLGHAFPGPEKESSFTLLRVTTDNGAEGYTFGAIKDVLETHVRPALLGVDPLDREAIWQKLNQIQRNLKGVLSNRSMAHVDEALWDLAGRVAGLPVYKLLGGFRTKVPAYASTMCGDDLESGLNTPAAYAAFAGKCIKRGFRALKLHTWMPPHPGAPDPALDIEACAAVRDAVGPNVTLMLDPWHFYHRAQALWIGRQLEKLQYHWLEEPMDEQCVEAYIWLARQLDIPVLGPEMVDGKHFARLDWIQRGACDLCRAGVADVGGITPLMKVVHLCECFGVPLELHGGGAATLQVLCAMGIPGEFYECGLLHPHLDIDQVPPWLKSSPTPLDSEGFVSVRDLPGLGLDINWDYIEENTIK